MMQKLIQVTIEVKDEQPKVIEFAKDSLTLGTNPSNDIVLRSSAGVPEQAFLRLTDAGFILDANGEAAQPAESTPPESLIESGDSLKVGSDVTLTFDIKAKNVNQPVKPARDVPPPRRVGTVLGADPSEEADDDEFIPPTDFDPFGANAPFEPVKTAADVVQIAPMPIGTSPLPKSENTPTAHVPKKENDLPLVKTNSREYCVGCLELLDPHDTREAYRKIVQCTQCEALYHAHTWEGLRACVRCENKQVRPVQITPPIPLHVQHKPTAIPPKTQVYQPPANSQPRVRVSRTPRPSADVLAPVGRLVTNGAVMLRDNAIMLLFVALITTISVYFMRIMVELPPAARTNFEEILDAVLRSAPPQLNFFIAGAVMTLSMALVLFPRALFNRLGYPSLFRRLVRLTALIILVGLAIGVLLQLHYISPELVNRSIQRQVPLLERFAYIGLAAAVLTLLATPVYRALTRRNNQPAYNPELASPSWRIISLVRFFLVCFLLLLVVYLTIITPFARNWISDYTLNQKQGLTSETQYLLFGMALATVAALMLYFPPSYKPFKRLLLLLRLIGVIGLLVLAAAIYTGNEEASSLLAASAVGIVGIIVLFPVQRAFS